MILLLVFSATGLQNARADEAVYQGNAEAKPIAFPVIFSEDETPNTQEYLVKMIRACTILGTTSLRIHNSGTIEYYPIFKGRPPDLYEVTDAIIGKQPICNSVRMWSKTIAQRFGYYADERFGTRMETIKLDSYDEKNCKASSIYFCREDQKTLKKENDSRKERLITGEKDFLLNISKNYSPQCDSYIKNLLELVDATIISALDEKNRYLKAIETQQQEVKIQQEKIAAEKNRREAALRIRQEEEFENYASAIKSGTKPIRSMRDAMIYYDPIDGSSYATNPPLKFPDERRYLSLDGVVETINGDTIVCTVGDNPNWGRWGFRTSKMKFYIPRQGELVQSIGRIVSLDKGQTLLGREVFFVVIDPVAFAINDSLFYPK
jgi:hypothetical protein